MYKFTEYVILDEDRDTGVKYLMDIEEGFLYKLNSTAALIVEGLMNNKNEEDLLNEIYEGLGEKVDRFSIEDDIKKFINSLLDKKYLVKF